jgi:hypothetical protein
VKDDDASASFRSNARTPRHEIVRFATSSLRKVGFAFAALAGLPMGVFWLFFSARQVHLSCTRDAASAGHCETVVDYVLWTSHESFDVQSLRGARGERYESKGRESYRVFLDVGGSWVPLCEPYEDPEQVDAAGRIDHFARDRSMPVLDEQFDPDFVNHTVFAGLFVLMGLSLACATQIYTAPRTLVLSEREGFARLEQRRWPFPRRTLWAVKLSDVCGARLQTEGKELRIVVDTREDGALIAVEHVDDGKPEMDEINRFIAGESGAASLSRATR